MRLPARGVNGGSAALNGAPFLARAQSAAMDSTGGLGWRDVPNALTIARVAALPVLAYAFYSPRAQRSGATVLLYAAIAATDAVDGFIARRFELISPFGAFLDPVRPERESMLCRRMKPSAAQVADKLLVCVALVLLTGELGQRLAVPSALILAREISVSALRECAAVVVVAPAAAVSRPRRGARAFAGGRARAACARQPLLAGPARSRQPRNS